MATEHGVAREEWRNQAELCGIISFEEIASSGERST